MTWTVTSAPSALWLSVASSSDGTHLVAVGGGGPIYTSANSGLTWTGQAGSPYANSVASSSDGSRLVAAVNGGQIYTSVDIGVSWTAQTGPPSAPWASVASSSDGTHLVAVVNGGPIYTAVATTGTVNGILSSSEQFQYVGDGVWQPVLANGTWLASGDNLFYKAGNVGIGTSTPTTALDVNGSIAASGTVTANGVQLTSDRNAKENFAALDRQALLAKVAALPLTEWNYKNDPAGTRHLGPMAQDFQTAFQLNGGDDKHISVVDESGVALAAIQGLNQKLDEKDAEIEKLKAKADKVDSLEKQLNELKEMVQALAEKK